jgi:hypothetical protein
VSLYDDVVNHMVASMTAPGVVFGFPESYNSDWSIQSSDTYGFVGHLYKASWALARGYLLTNDPKYRDAARKIVMQLWNNGGFDRTNGAPNFDFHYNTGLNSHNKEYWIVEQGFTSGITNWAGAATDADRAVYMEQADRSLCFYMNHMRDTQFGGVYFQMNPDGSAPVNDGTDAPTDKGDQWEGSYHNVELAYYTYVYGNLLLCHRPVTLYYRFDAETQDRSITVTPVALGTETLVVSSVTLAGQPFTSFDGASRTLTIPAGTGGVFAVTFTAH